VAGFEKPKFSDSHDIQQQHDQSAAVPHRPVLECVLGSGAASKLTQLAIPVGGSMDFLHRVADQI